MSDDVPPGSAAPDWPIERWIALIKGLEDASRLIDLGMTELHSLDGANDFNHGILHLLSHGFERLVKYTLFLALLNREGVAPDAAYMKGLGHDVSRALEALLDVVSNEPKYADRPAAAEDIAFMRDDPDLKRLIALYSRFGKLDRYFDLNVLIDPTVATSIMDPAAEWREIENDFFDRIPGGLEALASDPTALARLMPIVTGEIAAVLDRFHRCLARMWFWGAVGEDGPSSATSALSFINYLNDDELGTPR
ncbi:MAG: hypothetical protein JHC98_03005 [Thermoleophilaceae bacterium]|nr:hypothetical protein [Thermoleophilaceae bacterium]